MKSARPRLRHRTPRIRLNVGSRRSAASDIEEEDPYQEEESNTMKLSHAFFVVLVLHLVLIGGILGFNYIKAQQIPSLLKNHKSSGGAENPPASRDLDTENKTKVTDTGDASIIPSESADQNRSRFEPSSSQFRTHRVAQGETLQRIAVAYGVTVDQIRKANHITDVSDGQILQIPPRYGDVSSPASPASAPPFASQAHKPTQSAQAPIASSPSTEKRITGASQQKPAHHSTSTPSKQKNAVARKPTTEASSSNRGIRGARGAIRKEGNQMIYVVVRGDNPYSIARRLKVNYVQLLHANQIKDPTKLQIGAKLKIPHKAK